MTDYQFLCFKFSMQGLKEGSFYAPVFFVHDKTVEEASCLQHQEL